MLNTFVGQTIAVKCLVLYIVWTLLLLASLGSCRVFWVLGGKKSALDFPANVPHGPDWYWRLNRMHLNAVENLPIFAGLVLAAAVLHMNIALFDTLAVVVVLARMVQSLFHFFSTNTMMVNLRFGAFLAQITCFIAMAIMILSH